MVQDMCDYEEKEEALALLALLVVSQPDKQEGKGVLAEEFRKTVGRLQATIMIRILLQAQNDLSKRKEPASWSGDHARLDPLLATG